MTEQQRREQIMKMRHQYAGAATATMSDEEAIKIAQQNGGITQEQVIMAAMLGKMVNNGLTDIKKQAVGDGLKVGSVDMSKVMPSGIARTMGQAEISQQPISRQVPLEVPHAFPSTDIQPPIQVSQLPPLISREEPIQLELELDKKARYDDIYKKLQELEDKIIALNQKGIKILELLDKKKLKRARLDGTQTG